MSAPAAQVKARIPVRWAIVEALGDSACVVTSTGPWSQTFLVRNSWGADWGQAGYFTMPYAYFTTRGLSSDFWTIRIVT